MVGRGILFSIYNIDTLLYVLYSSSFCVFVAPFGYFSKDEILHNAAVLLLTSVYELKDINAFFLFPFSSFL